MELRMVNRRLDHFSCSNSYLLFHIPLVVWWIIGIGVVVPDSPTVQDGLLCSSPLALCWLLGHLTLESLRASPFLSPCRNPKNWTISAPEAVLLWPISFHQGWLCAGTLSIRGMTQYFARCLRSVSGFWFLTYESFYPPPVGAMPVGCCIPLMCWQIENIL